MERASQYKERDISSSDNVRIITLLYDGAADFTKLAVRMLEEENIPKKALYISKVTAIITELSSSLDVEKGKEIASRLQSLYTFIIDRLITANAKNDLAQLKEAQRVIEILRDGWKEMEAGESRKSGDRILEKRVEVRV